MMSLAEFKERVIEDGKASVAKDELITEFPQRLRGSLVGFELCKTLETPEDFDRTIKERHRECLRLKQAHVEPEEYWEYRYAGIQIEWVYECMKVAWSQAGMYDFPSWSGRAMMNFARIVGVDWSSPKGLSAN